MGERRPRTESRTPGSALAAPARPLTCAAAGAGAIPACRGCSGRHRAARAARGAGCPWPAPRRAARRRRTARAAGGGGPSRPAWPRAGVARPPARPPGARWAAACASRPLRPAEWPVLLAPGPPRGGAGRVCATSVNLGAAPPPPPPDPRWRPRGPSGSPSEEARPRAHTRTSRADRARGATESASCPRASPAASPGFVATRARRSRPAPLWSRPRQTPADSGGLLVDCTEPGISAQRGRSPPARPARHPLLSQSSASRPAAEPLHAP